ncbi:hypothetical protein WDW86_01440 [Bdellovibrionota bacterium FG-2]
MFISVNTKGNTLTRQMESQIEEVETDLLKEFGAKIQYTFAQVHSPNSANIMARLKNRGEMRTISKAIEAKFPNTPFLRFYIGPWNPAELPIPNPPQLRLVVRGGSLEDRAQAAEDLRNMLDEKHVSATTGNAGGLEGVNRSKRLKILAPVLLPAFT